MSTAIVVSEPKQAPDILSGSAGSREERGRALAEKFVNGVGKVVVKFIGELEPQIIEVRQDFKDKPKDERICGVTTFTEYCTAVLGYSLRHIERILEGRNPALSEAENFEACHRKAKRKLNARVKQRQNALPIRTKTNAEIVAEKVEEKTIAALEKQVAVLKHKLEVASTKPSPVTVEAPLVKDLKRIHAAEMKAHEKEIKDLTSSVEKLTVAYTTLRADGTRLAASATQVPPPSNFVYRAQTFLKKYGVAQEPAAVAENEGAA